MYRTPYWLIGWLMTLEGLVFVALYGGLAVFLVWIARELWKDHKARKLSAAAPKKSTFFVDSKVNVDGGTVIFKGNTSTKEGKAVKRLKQIRKGKGNNGQQ
jgi:hypothetical protein